jgi:catechol 2,3-dioxygenase-like lactoylglutathione lyase family enzyme
MLGRFLEFSVATHGIAASLDFYAKLGFSQAAVGETWPHPYAVVTDGRICFGLHQSLLPAPLITFVKPDLAKNLPLFERLGVEFAYRHLGEDVFHEVAWTDPSGHLIRLVEARTFSPGKRLGPPISMCGYFQEIALPEQNPADAKEYWEQFGFVGIDEPDARLAHVACTSDTIDIGLYDLKDLRQPTLVFDADDLESRVARLAEIGIEPSRDAAARLANSPAALYFAPEGTAILLAPGPQTD